MSEFQRKNAWNNGGTFDNPDLLWYAKGVKLMQEKSLDDKNSWWFFAAIHGKSSIWNTLYGVPKVPTSPDPSQSVQDVFWNQCQHQSWFFAPWHRGYLIALEEQVRSCIVSLGGPEDWALPYWNYLGSEQEQTMPPAFAEEKLPNGDDNPLFVTQRFGISGTGVIKIAIPPVSKDCQKNTIFTGSNVQTPYPGYGGPKTGFSHSGRVSGNLESNPHNIVHVQIGGSGGLMSNPRTAALDPIFYLHHANIDRMWAEWNQKGNTNPTDSDWLQGPSSIGARKFIMPLPNGEDWSFTPGDVTDLNTLDYGYQELFTESAAAEAKSSMNKRLQSLGFTGEEQNINEDMDLGDNSELIGANLESIKMKSSGIESVVNFNDKSFDKTKKSLAFAPAAQSFSLPDQVYLQIENVTGNVDGNVLSVSINEEIVGYVSLFGLCSASDKNDHHAGEGLSFIIDITQYFDKQKIENNLDFKDLKVKIVPDIKMNEKEDVIKIGRISVYRQEQSL